MRLPRGACGPQVRWPVVMVTSLGDRRSALKASRREPTISFPSRLTRPTNRAIALAAAQPAADETSSSSRAARGLELHARGPGREEVLHVEKLQA